MSPEQELAVQVGSFYWVHVCYGDVSIISCTKPHKGKVFKKLTADSTSSNLESNRKKMKLSDVFYNVAESHSSVVAHHYIEIRHSVAPVLPDVLQTLRQR